MHQVVPVAGGAISATRSFHVAGTLIVFRSQKAIYAGLRRSQGTGRETRSTMNSVSGRAKQGTLDYEVRTPSQSRAHTSNGTEWASQNKVMIVAIRQLII